MNIEQKETKTIGTGGFNMKQEEMVAKIIDGILGLDETKLPKGHVVIKESTLNVETKEINPEYEYDYDTAELRLMDLGDFVVLEMIFPVANDINMIQTREKVQDYGKEISELESIREVPIIEFFLMTNVRQPEGVASNSYIYASNPIFWATEAIDNAEDLRLFKMLFRADDFGVYTFEE